MTATNPAAAAAGRRVEADRRHQRVLAAITAGPANELSVASVARIAGVHRSYLYRHPELVELVHEAARGSAPEHQQAERVSAASLRADLAHARDRAARAESQVHRLQQRLSEALGQQVWSETGLGPIAEASTLRREVEKLRQQVADLSEELDERTQELDAARVTNRELMAQINLSN